MTAEQNASSLELADLNHESVSIASSRFGLAVIVATIGQLRIET